MSNQAITYLVVGCAGVFGLAAYVGLILLPAVTSYTKVWERVAAGFLSLYVLAALIGVGVAGGLAVIWFWDSI